MNHLLYLLTIITFFFNSASLAGPLTPQEKLGKEIYLKTVSPSGKEIKAFIGIASTEAPGAVMVCANCHGRNGRGRPGSGIIPSNIAWKELTKSYGVKHISGREHPAYNEQTLARAITQGIDPAGNRLNPAMPVYSMDKEDLHALIAYLKHLGTELDPGLSETTIRVGTFLPSGGRMAETGQAMKAVMMAYFNEINLQGGIYNRNIELQVVDYGSKEKAPLSAVTSLIEEKEIFAMVGGLPAGVDKEIADLTEGAEVPLIGPFTLHPQDFALNRFTFYLFSGLRDQVLSLINFSRQRLQIPIPRSTMIYPKNEIPPEVVDAVTGWMKKEGWSSMTTIPYSPERFEPLSLVAEQKQKEIEAIFFLGSWEELKALVREGDKIGWAPYLFLSSSKVGRDIFNLPVRFRQKVYLAYPTLPSDQTESGLKEFFSFLEKNRLGRGHLPSQIFAYCAAKILVEGMKLSGRDLSREKLVTKLEGLYQFETGLTPRMTYGPNRRIGALGAYIVSVNLEEKKFDPVGGWISPE